MSLVDVKGATCDLSELDLRSQRRRFVSGGDNSVPPQDAQRQLRPRRVDGGTPRHLLCAAVYSAGSQLPLEGTERYQMAQMVKSRFCNAGCSGESDTNSEGNDHTGRRMTLGKRARERIGENRSPERTEGGAPGPRTKQVSVFGRGVQCNVH